MLHCVCLSACEVSAWSYRAFISTKFVAQALSYLAVKLFSKNSNLYDHGT